MLVGQLTSYDALHLSESNQWLLITNQRIYVFSNDVKTPYAIGLSELPALPNIDREVETIGDAFDKFRSESFSKSCNWSPLGLGGLSGCLVTAVTSRGRLFVFGATEDRHVFRGPYAILFAWNDFVDTSASVHGVSPTSLCWSPLQLDRNGCAVSFLAVGLSDGRIGVWSVSTTQCALHFVDTWDVQEGDEQRPAMTTVQWSPDGRYLFCSNAVGRSWLMLFNAMSADGSNTFPIGHEDLSPVSSSSWSADSSTLIFSKALNVYVVKGIHSNETSIELMSTASSPVVATAFTQNGQVFTGHLNGSIAIFKEGTTSLYRLCPEWTIQAQRELDMALSMAEGDATAEGADANEDETAEDSGDVLMFGLSVSPFGRQLTVAYTNQTGTKMAAGGWTESQRRCEFTTVDLGIDFGNVDEAVMSVLTHLQSAGLPCSAELICQDFVSGVSKEMEGLQFAAWNDLPHTSRLLSFIQQLVGAHTHVHLQAAYYLLNYFASHFKDELLDLRANVRGLLQRLYFIRHRAHLSPVIANWVGIEFPYDTELIEFCATNNTMEPLQNPLLDQVMCKLLGEEPMTPAISEQQTTAAIQQAMSGDKCPLCQTTSPVDDLQLLVCPRGHVWERCALSMEAITEPMDVRQCTRCHLNVKASSYPGPLCWFCGNVVCCPGSD